MTEFENTLSKITNLSESTKGTYISMYKRLMKLTENTPILNMSEQSIINAINIESIPPNSQNSLFTIALVIRRNNNASYEKLVKFRDNTLIKKIHERKLEKNLVLKDELPSKKVLDTYLKKLYLEKDYVGYIINFLLLNYGVRNKDLNCIITADKEVTFLANKKSKLNYLYVTKKYVLYIRRDYKTYDTYGEKKHKIERRPFVESCLNLLDHNYDVPLLRLSSGEPISEESVNKIVQRKTYNELGEGKYFKINIMDAKKDRNIKRIRDLSASRGTSLETVFREYDIDNEN